MASAANRERRDWKRDELTRVLSLYFRTPFGQLHRRNPEVVLLSSELSRTPSAVALKLVNFASLDPDLIGRGVTGMQNASKLDREIWSDYYGNWEALHALDVASQVDDADTADLATGRTDRLGETVLRRGQTYFRSVVLAAYEGRCCITGIASAPLLRASHIIPWSENNGLRLEPRNGLCLSALHDAAFDRGLISLDKGLQVLVSGQLADSMPADTYQQCFGRYAGKPIRRPERLAPLEEALNHHRHHIFVG